MTAAMQKMEKLIDSINQNASWEKAWKQKIDRGIEEWVNEAIAKRKAYVEELKKLLNENKKFIASTAS